MRTTTGVTEAKDLGKPKSESAPRSSHCHTPFPWCVEPAGGHAKARIFGSGVVQTNGWPEPRGGIRNASYSDTVCEFPNDLKLPGPSANAKLITAVPELVEALRAIVAHEEAIGGGLAVMSATCRIAQEALERAGV